MLTALSCQGNADINAVSNNYQTPLSCAVVGGRVECAKYLLQCTTFHGIDQRDCEGNSYLHLAMAASENKQALTALLINNGWVLFC